MSRNIVRHLRFSKSEYEAICSKAEYLKIPEGRFIRKIAVQENLKDMIFTSREKSQERFIIAVTLLNR